MNKQLKKSNKDYKSGMLKLSITNQVFGYLTAVVVLAALIFFFTAMISGDGELLLIALLFLPIYIGIPAAIVSLVWIILSIVQCFKFEKVGEVDGIKPKTGATVLGVFLSISFLVIAAAAAVIIITQIAEGGGGGDTAAFADEAEDALTQIGSYVLLILPFTSLGQAIFNTVYTKKLKKSL